MAAAPHLPFRGIDPQDILDSGQILPIKKIQTMLDQHGFVLMRNRGSHFIYRHPQHSSLGHDQYDKRGFLLLYEMKQSPKMQKDAARLCLLVRKAEAKISNVHSAVLKSAFTAQSARELPGAIIDLTKKTEHEEMLCDVERVTIEGFPDHIVLRSKEYPQVGTIVSSKTSLNLLQNALQDIHENEEIFDAMLAEAKKSYEFQIQSKPDGSLTVRQPVYELEQTIPAYHPLSADAPYDLLEQLCARTKAIDDHRRNIVFAKGTKIVGQESLSDGMAKLKLRKIDKVTEERLPFSVIASKGRRLSEKQFLEAAYQIFMFDMGAPNRFKEIMEGYFGYTVENLPGGKLGFVHKFYTDQQGEVYDPAQMVSLQTIAEESNPVTRQILMDEFFSKWEECQMNLDTGFDLLEETVRPNLKRCDLLIKTLESIKYNTDRSIPEQGALFSLKFTHEYLPPLGLQCIYLGKGKIMPSPVSLDNFQTEVAQIKALLPSLQLLSQDYLRLTI